MDTADILFRYLREMIYNPETASLELEQLPEEFRQLGQGLQQLDIWMKEMRRLSLTMARGDLSCLSHDKENVLAAPLKELQGTLRHLTWQTQQVAKGDYGQTVDFMGDFSEAFNEMTRQLKERRDALIEEKRHVEEKNAELEQTFELAMAFANNNDHMIFIHSLDGQGELFQNRSAREFVRKHPESAQLIQEHLAIWDRQEIRKTMTWEFSFNMGKEDGECIYFSVESYPIVWRHQRAIVHIAGNDTERRKREHHMYRLAYADPLTGLYNQRYAMEQMRALMEQHKPFTLSFIDVDYLKYCNDTLGHKAGDLYLLDMAQSLGTLGGVLCRTGGDEFMIIQLERTAEQQDEELEHVRSLVQIRGEKMASPRSFSYATCEIPANPEKTLEEYILIVDSRLYQYKVKNKKPLADMVYRDDRKLD